MKIPSMLLINRSLDDKDQQQVEVSAVVESRQSTREGVQDAGEGAENKETIN